MTTNLERLSFGATVNAKRTNIRESATRNAAGMQQRTGCDRQPANPTRSGARGGAFGEIIPMPAGADDAPLVLVVDDQRTTRIACSAYLAFLGYRVQYASSTSEALKMFTSETSVVVLKMLLPDGESLGLLKMIRSRFPRIKVVMIAGREQCGAHLAVEFGAFDILTKPVRPDDLEASVARAVEIQMLTTDHRASA